MLDKELQEILKKEFVIPEITDKKLFELIRKMVPVVDKDGSLYHIEMPDPKYAAYTWSPKFLTEAQNLVPAKTIYTLHSSYPGLFNPSIAEVFAFIQDIDDIDECVAFTTTFAEHHPSGYGNIGKTVLFKKITTNVPNEKHLVTKAANGNEPMFRATKLDIVDYQDIRGAIKKPNVETEQVMEDIKNGENLEEFSLEDLKSQIKIV